MRKTRPTSTRRKAERIERIPKFFCCNSKKTTACSSSSSINIYIVAVFRVSCTVRARTFRSGFFCFPVSMCVLCLYVREGWVRDYYDWIYLPCLLFRLSLDLYSLWWMRIDEEYDDVVQYTKQWRKTNVVLENEKYKSISDVLFHIYFKSPPILLFPFLPLFGLFATAYHSIVTRIQ